MKCFLHIGTEKTGTTTIQAFFAQNQKALNKFGFSYLNSFNKPNNNLLAVCAFNKGRKSNLLKNYNIHSEEDLQKFQEITIAKAANELRSINKANTVIFSSEHLQSRLTTIEEIKKLKEILIQLGFLDIQIIIYLRNPADIASSLYSTSIKVGNYPKDVPPPNDNYFENICNHKKTIEKWASVFGENKMIIRLFRKDKFNGNSLIHDFCHIINLKQEKFLQLILLENQNESLSNEGLNLLKSLNQTFNAQNKSGKDYKREELLKLITKHFSDTKFIMKQELIDDYNSYFLESNDWVKENYFPNEKILFPKISSNNFENKNIIDKNTIKFIADMWLENCLLKETNESNIIKLYKKFSFKLKKLIEKYF